MDFGEQRILVTGATGFLGGVVTRQLSDNGTCQIRVLARDPKRIPRVSDLPNVEVVIGDIVNLPAVRSAMKDVDLVIHVAAALGGSIEEQTLANVEGTRHLAQASVEAGVKRFVHVSTISVYGYRNRTNVTEENPYDPGADAYHITKVKAEQVLKQIANDHAMPYSIIRPSMIYGPYSSAWTKEMFKVAKRGVWIGDGSGSAFPIYVDDVSRLCLIACVHPDAVGEAFNCTPDPSPTWREFLGEYAKLAGVERWSGVSPRLLQWVAPIVSRFVSKHSQLKDLPDLIPFVTTYITYENKKAWRLLGWKPQVTLQEGVQRCIPYLQEQDLL
jgi:nucleoside-diphosphate-sugar epimerase